MNEESLFAAALERATTAERQAFLDLACAGDDALRQRVERLLDVHDRATGILDQFAVPTSVTAATLHFDADARPAPEEGITIIANRYRLIERIGAGGMGTVWKAEQTEPVRRIVALKLTAPGMSSETVLSRFQAERQALARMDHPNIAKVLDGGMTENGRPFFVMEYVEGVPLTQFCDDARLSIAQRLALFVAVCQAVQHAHTKGIIHRDLKPGNILVGWYDGQPAPKVIDFGLAKATQEPLSERALVTAHGTVLGTPLYMSPEQAELSNPDVDARTDIYALGVILYELLTGTTPLDKQRFHDGAWYEMLRLIKEEDPPPPSARLSNSDSLPTLAALRQLESVRLPRMVRGELDWIVMKCLEKDRGRRYETASGLARDVQRYLADESVEAGPPSARYRLSKFVRRNRWAMLATSIMFLLLVGGIVGTSLGFVRADRARTAAILRAEGERKANEKAQKLLRQVETANEILASAFKDLDPRAEEKEGRPLRLILGDRLDHAAKALEGDAVGEPLVVANLQDRLGQTYWSLGHSAKAKAMFTKALAIRRALLGPSHADTLKVMSHQASALKEVGELDEATRLYESVKDAQTQSLGTDHRDTLATATSLAMVYWKVGRATEAATLLEQVRDDLIKKCGPDDRQTIDTLDALAAVYDYIGNNVEAVALAEQVRDQRVKVYGEEHHLTVVAMTNLGSRYQNAGQMGRARALFEKARDRLVPKLGAEHPVSLNVLDNLARIYRAYKKLPEAIALAEQVRDARVMTLGAYHPDTIYTMHNLASAYQAAGQDEKALAMHQQAVAGLEKLNFNHAGAYLMIWSLCESLEKRGRTDRADAWRQKWLAAVRTRNGPDSGVYATELAKQSEDLLRYQRYAKAEPMLRECVAILQKAHSDDVTTSHARSMLGDALLAQKQYAEAEPLLIQGYEGFKAHEAQISPLYAQYRIAEAGDRIVRLYEAWNRPEKAAEWRTKVPPLPHGHPKT